MLAKGIEGELCRLCGAEWRARGLPGNGGWCARLLLRTAAEEKEYA